MFKSAYGRKLSLSVNQLDYLKQEQNGFYYDDYKIDHRPTSFLRKCKLSGLGVLALWHSKVLWCSDSLNCYIFTTSSVCSLNYLFCIFNDQHEGRGVRQIPNQTAVITPSLSMLLLAGFLLISCLD